MSPLPLIFTVFTLTNIASFTAAKTTICSPSNLSAVSQTCAEGHWPLISDQKLSIPESTELLRVVNVSWTFTGAVLQPIPFLPKLRYLAFISFVAKYDNSTAGRFPLRNLTRLLTKASIEHLVLRNLEMSYLIESDFEGFLGLQQLDLFNCNIAFIHPNTFSALGNDPSGSLRATHDQNPSIPLRKLRVGGDKALTIFPWEILLPVKDSIESVVLVHNYKLCQISYNLPGNDQPTFAQLQQLAVHSTDLKTIPRAVLDTFRCTAQNTTKPFHLFFKNNSNVCGSCDLVPLVTWATAGPLTIEPNRLLDVTCSKTLNEENFTVTGSLAYWQYSIRNCQDIKARNVQVPTAPSSSAVLRRSGCISVLLSAVLIALVL